MNNNRRPLKTRQQAWVKTFTRILVKTNITPNHISLFSVICGGFAGLAFYAFACSHNIWWLLLATIGIQLRLLCNLMDGLVAVEGGKSTPSGELFNDIPDRFSDVFILVGAGYGLTDISWGITLGWCAAVFAVITAYIRTLGTSLGAPTSYAGPMAKQHRMGLLTVATLCCMLEYSLFHTTYLLRYAMIVITIGSAFTCYRRATAIYQHLEKQTS